MGFVWWMADGRWDMSDDPEIPLLTEDAFISVAPPDSDYSIHVVEEVGRSEICGKKPLWCVDFGTPGGAIQAYAHNQRDMMAIVGEWLPIVRDLIAIEHSAQGEP